MSRSTATTAVDPLIRVQSLKSSKLPSVRRFEAAGFRAWPAASVHYDGTWAIRLTAGHPAKRLNSINPLDPGDCDNLAERVAKALSLIHI